MLTFPSPTSSTSTTSNVSTSPPDFINQFVYALGKKFDESQHLTHNLLIGIDERIQSLDMGERVVDHTYSTETLNVRSSAMPTSAP